MTTFLITLFGVLMTIGGYAIYRNWFNHLTVYSVVWTVVLSLNSLNLIDYNPITPAAWVYMISAWILLYLGTLAVRMATGSSNVGEGSASGVIEERTTTRRTSLHAQYFKNVIIILSILGFIGIATQWYWLFRQFGGLTEILVSGHKLYSMRYHGELSEGIPYLTALPISGSFFSGIYTGERGRMTVIALIPLLLVIGYSVGTMGRTPLLIAVALFFSSYILYTKCYVAKSKSIFTVKRLFAVLLVFVLLTAIFDIIKVARSLNESYRRYGESKILRETENIPFFTPSVYFYLTGPPSTFSEYLKAGGEDVPVGRYTLGTIYRFLSKFGLAKDYTYVQPFYLTPAPMNVATYLRELHADYREWGLAIFPFMLGVLCAYLYDAAHKKLWRLAAYSYLYAMIIMSFSYNIISTGHWFINFFVTIFIAVVVQKKIERADG